MKNNNKECLQEIPSKKSKSWDEHCLCIKIDMFQQHVWLFYSYGHRNLLRYFLVGFTIVISQKFFYSKGVSMDQNVTISESIESEQIMIIDMKTNNRNRNIRSSKLSDERCYSIHRLNKIKYKDLKIVGFH